MIKTHKMENMNMSKMSYGKHVACVRGQEGNGVAGEIVENVI